MENCLSYFEYPEKYKTAFMRLMQGTIQFEVNGHLSGDYRLEKGTGQGDPKVEKPLELKIGSCVLKK